MQVMSADIEGKVENIEFESSPTNEGEFVMCAYVLTKEQEHSSGYSRPVR